MSAYQARLYICRYFLLSRHMRRQLVGPMNISPNPAQIRSQLTNNNQLHSLPALDHSSMMEASCALCSCFVWPSRGRSSIQRLSAVQGVQDAPREVHWCHLTSFWQSARLHPSTSSVSSLLGASSPTRLVTLLPAPMHILVYSEKFCPF